VRQRLGPSGWDAVKSPLLLIVIGLVAAMAALGLADYSRDGNHLGAASGECQLASTALHQSRRRIREHAPRRYVFSDRCAAEHTAMVSTVDRRKCRSGWQEGS
jgi:hypothetical protein